MNGFLKKFRRESDTQQRILRELEEIRAEERELLERLCNLERVLVDGQMKETLERLCNLEHILVDGQMKEALIRLQNIEKEMVVRLQNIEDKTNEHTADRKIRIKLFEKGE